MLLALAVAACSQSIRREAERALEVGPHVRALQVAEQRAALATLSSLTCDDADVCRVKTACLQVVTPTLRALEQKSEAMEHVRAASALDAAPESIEVEKERARVLLDAAHDGFEAGKTAVPACEAALSILERAAHAK